jgi:drug/metabolite transporter (DMT)-like permease
LRTSESNFYLIRWSKRLFDLPYILLPLAPLFWSGNFILGRAVRTALPPLGLAFWRWLVASVIIFNFARPHLKRDWSTLLRHWKFIVLLAFLGISVFNSLTYTGLQFTTAINGVLMQSIMPVLIVAMTYLLFREMIRPVQTLGIFFSLSGAITIISQGNLKVLTGLSLNIGDILVLIAIVCYAAYSALLRKRPPLHPLSFLAATFSAGTIMLFPFYLWEHVTRQVMPFNRITVVSVGYVAIFPSILAYLCFNRGVELLGANRAGLFIHLMPVFGSIMAIVFLGETLKMFHAVGIVLILSGIVLATQSGSERERI